MTFKEELAQKAYEARTNIDVSENIKRVKDKLLDSYLSREFTISLIMAKTTMAIGGYRSNYVSFFIPNHLDPNLYKQVFISALKELGFTDDDISISYNNHKSYDEYLIKLIW